MSSLKSGISLGIVVLLVGSCKTSEKSSSAPKYALLEPCPNLGLRNIAKGKFSICFSGTPLSTSTKNRVKSTLVSSLNQWTKALGPDMYPARTMTINFGSCVKADLKVNIDPNITRASATCGEINLNGSDNPNTILHELGHEFAGLGDLYMENDRKSCQPFQPHSTMCSHDAPDLSELHPDDVAGIQEMYRVIFKGGWTTEQLKPKVTAAIAAAQSQLVGCTLSLKDLVKPKPDGVDFALLLTAQNSSGRKDLPPLNLDARLNVSQMRDNLLIMNLAPYECRGRVPSNALAKAISRYNSLTNTCRLDMPSAILPPSDELGDLAARLPLARTTTGPADSFLLLRWLDDMNESAVTHLIAKAIEKSGPGFSDCAVVAPPFDYPSTKSGDEFTFDQGKGSSGAHFVQLSSAQNLSYELSPVDASSSIYLYSKDAFYDLSQRIFIASKDRPDVMRRLEPTGTLTGPFEGFIAAVPYDHQGITKLRFGNFVPITGTVYTVGASPTLAVFTARAPYTLQVEVDKAGDFQLEIENAPAGINVKWFGPDHGDKEIPTRLQASGAKRLAKVSGLTKGRYMAQIFLTAPNSAAGLRVAVVQTSVK